MVSKCDVRKINLQFCRISQIINYATYSKWQIRAETHSITQDIFNSYITSVVRVLGWRSTGQPKSCIMKCVSAVSCSKNESHPQYCSTMNLYSICLAYVALRVYTVIINEGRLAQVCCVLSTYTAPLSSSLRTLFTVQSFQGFQSRLYIALSDHSRDKSIGTVEPRVNSNGIIMRKPLPF